MFPLGATTTHSLGVLLNTWPVNNYMKGQSTCTTGPRVYRECTRDTMLADHARTHSRHRLRTNTYRIPCFSSLISSFLFFCIFQLPTLLFLLPVFFSPRMSVPSVAVSPCSSTFYSAWLDSLHLPWENVNLRRGFSRWCSIQPQIEKKATTRRKRNRSYMLQYRRKNRVVCRRKRQREQGV